MKNFFYNMFLIKDGEAVPLLHFWFIFMVILGVGLAFGRASADALFLSRYGAEYLPVIYIMFAPLLAAVSIIYAALVDYLPSEKFFKVILIFLMFCVVISWLLITKTNNTIIYPVYYIINKIASELLLVHGSLYLVHNYNTIQAKRLFPIIFTGEQLGFVLGGFLVSISTSIIDIDGLPLIWILFMAIGVIQLHLWHKIKGASPYYQKQKKSGSRIKSVIQSVYQGLKFSRESLLLRNASFALFFLVIIYYILSYSTNRIFVESFKNEQDLAEFLGLLTAGTSIITLTIQLFITNRIINHYGIKKLNLVFPLITASAASALLISFTLTFAVLVSVVRDSLLNSLQNPLRIIFLNALPGYMQGRAGAVSIALVMPLALLVCGILLWVFRGMEHVAYFLIPCLLLALAFLYYSHKMNQTYTKTLTTHLKEHLYLPETDSSNIELDEESINSFQEIFEELPQARTITVSLLAKHSPEKSIEFLIPKLDNIAISDVDVYLNSLFRNSNHLLSYETLKQIPVKDQHLQSTLLQLLAEFNYPEAVSMAQENIDSKSPRMRTAIAYTFLKFHQNHDDAIKIWEELLDGDKYNQLSSLALILQLDEVNHYEFSKLSKKIKHSVENLLMDDDLSIAGRALKELPFYLNSLNQEIVKKCMRRLHNQANPELRIYSTYGLRLLDDQDRYQLTYNLLCDTHTKVKYNALSTLNLEKRDKDKAINQWLINGEGHPKVQSLILEEVIENELVSHELLKHFAIDRACEANHFLKSKDIIDKSSNLKSTYKLLSLVMKERQIQLIDLALQALTPLCAKDQITVIRAALTSNNSQHIANASEILNNIENQPATKIIEQQLNNVVATIQDEDKKINLNNIDDVLLWTEDLSDPWISDIAKIIRGNAMIDNNSRSLIERISLLKQTDIFSEVLTDDLVFVAKELDETKYFSGDHVFDINEHGDQMYIITKGKIGISISPDPESTDYITILEAGSSFGEMNLLDSLPRSASAHVLEDSFLLTLKKNKLLGLLGSYPELALGILRALSSKVREGHMRNIELQNQLIIN